MAQAATFIDVDARAVRVSEVSDASFVNGMNNGSNQAGIGISNGPTDLVGTPEQFTLLDQNEDARTPQLGQSLGGVALGDGETVVASQAIDLIDNDVSGNGEVTIDGSGATLTTLAAGWVAGVQEASMANKIFGSNAAVNTKIGTITQAIGEPLLDIDSDIGGGGATDFTGLDDTPADYSGAAAKVVAVNAGEDGLEFVDAGGGGGGLATSEGQFNPTITDGSNVATMVRQDGYWTRVGNLVTCVMDVNTSSLGSINGDLKLGNLPFSNIGVFGTAYGGGAFGMAALPAGVAVSGYVDGNSTTIVLQIWNATSGTAALTSTHWGSSGRLMMTCQYTAVAV